MISRNLTEATLATGYRAVPHYTYEKLMDSTTYINSSRKPYVTFRGINDAEGKVIRREWADLNNKLEARYLG